MTPARAFVDAVDELVRAIVRDARSSSVEDFLDVVEVKDRLVRLLENARVSRLPERLDVRVQGGGSGEAAEADLTEAEVVDDLPARAEHPSGSVRFTDVVHTPDPGLAGTAGTTGLAGG